MRYILNEVFTDSVKNNPRNIAIIEESGEKISYFDLNILSNKFANAISANKEDICLNPFIGILSDVCINSVASIIAILKLGGVYVPLDEGSPIERLNFIIQNTKIDIIITTNKFFKNFYRLFLNEQIKNIILIDQFDNSININKKLMDFSFVNNSSVNDPATVNQLSDDLAYVLHSSGSTGVPKGIMLTHRNARTFVDWMQKEFKLTENDIVMSRSPFKFDLSVFDIFNTLKVGAKLVCFDWQKHKQTEDKHKNYVKLIEKSNATILYTTPSTFITLMNHGDLGKNNLHLRTIMYAGEPFPVDQLKKLKNLLHKTKIANIYGPTETNIITYFWIDDICDSWKSVPLGNIVDDTEIIIVSEDGKKICDINEVGELWCRGGTVTIGYLGLEEKTKSHLVISPFSLYPKTFWKTGDFGYKDEKGLLHYKGRKDHMIKINGYRVEIGEIEAAISKHLDVDLACVVYLEKDGKKILCCFYSTISYNAIKKDDFTNFLLEYIPKYMIPSEFIKKDLLPKTSSDKIDRVKLIEEYKFEHC